MAGNFQRNKSKAAQALTQSISYKQTQPRKHSYKCFQNKRHPMSGPCFHLSPRPKGVQRLLKDRSGAEVQTPQSIFIQQRKPDYNPE